MEKFSLVLLASIMLTITACTKAVPDLSNLKSLTGFSLDQNSITVSSKASLVFSVSGRCIDNFYDVQMSLDEGKTWKTIKDYDPAAVINCKTSGNFSAAFSINSSQLPVSIATLSSYNLRFRAESEFGYSDSFSYLISFTGKPMQGHIVAGAVGTVLNSSGSSYKMAGRIKAISPGGVLTTTNYKLRGILTYE
jgi:hypothetical protein